MPEGIDAPKKKMIELNCCVSNETIQLIGETWDFGRKYEIFSVLCPFIIDGRYCDKRGSDGKHRPCGYYGREF